MPRALPPISRAPSRASRAIAVGAWLVAAHTACARGVLTEGVDPVESFSPTVGLQQPLACVQRECPAPFATCPGRDGLCTTNLENDAQNCGACGAVCPDGSGLGGTFLCAGGKCVLGCDAFRADCNKSPTDGCETELYDDDANCGGCGVVCPSDKPCWRGACGCPNGLTRCGDDCIDLSSDRLNCGACGSICEQPADPNDPRWRCGPAVTPQNTRWSCVGGGCTQICEPRYGDCNDNFCGDGCETDLSDDPKNCGACGNACGAGQQCVRGRCLCPPGTSRCGNECVDLKTDPTHCGFCFSRCPGPSRARPGRPASGGPRCTDGVCSYVCNPGFADCNGRLDDGCEADLATDQANCGACGTACRADEGQPCVGGVCLTKACEPPRAPR